jgi:probable DNA metabolism protein
MFMVRLQGETDFAGWREGARALRLAEAPPDAAVWRVGEAAGLFDGEPPPAPPPGGSFCAPRAFVELAQAVICHRSETRFDLLYRLLWRLQKTPHLLADLTDRDVGQAMRMQRQVHDAEHKMHAFLRFRRVEGTGEPETYAAWFEPAHHVVERGAAFFVERMANLRFSILTPDLCAHWRDGALDFAPGVDAGQAPAEDALEQDWRAYFVSVFNPARVNARLMGQHMPRRYWRNMPEAAAIPALLSEARGQTRAMLQAEPSEPSRRRRLAAAPVADAEAEPGALATIAGQLQACRRCELWRDATQAVAGEGPSDAALMLVGEQPGDLEDLAGRPFLGPAGQLLDRALAEADVPREACYVTNAVKHFKHEPRGKRRIHQTPHAGEVKACRWWLQHELRLVRPKVVVSLGATAAGAVFGRPVAVTRERGVLGEVEGGAIGFVTVHPSFLLRLPDAARQAEALHGFVADLKAAFAICRSG